MIVFENNGEIDPRSITTFGVSSKDNSNAIGYFGTGLKYAIAILLREGCSIEIYAGLNKLSFGLIESNLRNDTFKFITMNDQPISFTTELGKNWELWQAFREVYCNCIDENGDTYHSTDKVIPEVGKTKIIVHGSKFKDLYYKRDEIVITEPFDVKPVTNSVVFFKGIRAHDLKTPSINTYNLKKGITLTEDRTIKSEWDMNWEMSKCVVSSDNEAVIRRAVIKTTQSKYEDNLMYDSLKNHVSDTFVRVVSELRRDKKFIVNERALKAIGFTQLDDLPEVSDSLDSLSEKKLKKAINFCEQLGYIVTQYPIIVTDKLPVNFLGLAKENKIYLSPMNFEKGTKYLAATLIEEYIHNKYGYNDETYQMQTFLFDNIVTLGERLLGEPL